MTIGTDLDASTNTAHCVNGSPRKIDKIAGDNKLLNLALSRQNRRSEKGDRKCICSSELGLMTHVKPSALPLHRPSHPLSLSPRPSPGRAVVRFRGTSLLEALPGKGCWR